MWFLWFVVGLVLGGILVWFWRQREEQRRIDDVREGWEAKYRHALEEVKRADAAHEETKIRLREAEARVSELQTENRQLREELAQRAPAVQRREVAEAPARWEPAPSASAGAVTTSRAEARLREIDAKLAQLPAGSSARGPLLEERARLRREVAPGASGDAAAGSSSGSGKPQASAKASDDLKHIRGIGPVLEKKLHELGITSLRQIAELTPSEIARIDEQLDFKGRILREKWIEQARSLLGQSSDGSG